MPQVSAVNNNNHFLQAKATKQASQSKGEDFLLLAGSHLSATDIYNRENDLPMDRTGKRYDADAVDDLMVIINGIFTSISEQAYRNDKTIKQLRSDLEATKSNLVAANAVQTKMQQQIDDISSQRDALQAQVANSVSSEAYQKNLDLSHERVKNLSKQLETRNRDYSEMLQSTSEEMQHQADKIESLQAQIASLTSENTQLKLDNHELQHRDAKKHDDADLQHEYDMLQFKYNSIQQMSADRIKSLADEVSHLRAELDK